MIGVRLGFALDPGLVLSLAAVTFGLGVVIGFIGAGGAGLVVALLSAFYGLPVHAAIGTALATMCFVTVAGAVSHLREGNLAPRVGTVVGLSGAFGAVLGAGWSQGIPEAMLRTAAGLALWGLAALVWLRTRLHPAALPLGGEWAGDGARPPVDWGISFGLGFTGGAAAAFFGVGMAPFLQLGFLSLLRLPLRQTVGTTMLALVFISAAGSLALAGYGDVSPNHLLGATVGLAGGAFLGARFTKRAPRWLLRVSVVAVPVIAGSILLFVG